jgi:endonuclease YncB( thermonuclease family)
VCSLHRALAGAALAAVLLASPHGALAATSPLTARADAHQLEGPARVVDGDTLALNGKGGARVRLYGIDAPESKQTCRREREQRLPQACSARAVAPHDRAHSLLPPACRRLSDGSDWACGAAATDALRAKVAAAGGAAHCVVLNSDQYGRDVCLCDVGGDDVATWMVSHGWALAYKQYGGAAFAGAEAKARASKLGVWSAESFTVPWQWRAEQRAASAAARGGK